MFTIDTFNSIFLFTNGFSLPVFCTFPHVRMIYMFDTTVYSYREVMLALEEHLGCSCW
jgi:hypothetical protein